MSKFEYYNNSLLQNLGLFTIINYGFDLKFSVQHNMTWAVGFTIIHYLCDLYTGDRRS